MSIAGQTRPSRTIYVTSIRRTLRYDTSLRSVAGEREENVRREIVRADAFEESVAALGDSHEVTLVLDTLIQRARRWPHAGELIPGTAARVLRSLPYGGFPAIRLIYRVTEDFLYLYRADRYDVLSARPRGSA